MSKFVGDLSGDDKEALKDTLQTAGSKILEQALAGRAMAEPLKAIEAPPEEVNYYRGRRHAYLEFLDFMRNARAKLTNYTQPE